MYTVVTRVIAYAKVPLTTPFLGLSIMSRIDDKRYSDQRLADTDKIIR